MGHLRFSLTPALFYVIALMSCFLLEGVALLTNNPLAGLDNFVFFLIAIPIIFLMIVYYALEHKKNRVKIDWILGSLLLLIFIISTSIIWNMPAQTFTLSSTQSIVVSFTWLQKFRYTIELGIGLSLLYSMMFLLCRTQLRNKKLFWLLWIFIIANLVIVAFSFYLDFDTYKTIFTSAKNTKGVSSFYFNENAYGGSILLAMLSCEALNLYKKRWYHEFLIGFFSVMLVFSSSTTCIILALAFITIIFLFEIVRLFCRKWKLALFLTCLVVVAVAAIIITHFVLVTHNVDWAVNFDNFVTEDVFDKNFLTFSGRTKIWQAAIDYLTNRPLNFFFGCGYGTSRYYLNGAISVSNGNPAIIYTLHNGILELLFQFGIVGLLIYAALLIYFLYCLIRLLIKKQFSMVLVYFVLFAVITAYSFMESLYFFELNIMGLYAGLVFLLPPIVTYRHMSRPQLVKEAAYCDIWKKPINPYYLFRLLTAIIASTIVAFLSILFIPSFYETIVWRFTIECLKLLTIALFLIPNLVFCFYLCFDRKLFVKRLIIHSIVIVLISLACYIPSVLVKTSQPYSLMVLNYAFLILLVIYNLIFMVLAREYKHYFSLLLKGIFKTPKLGLLFQLATYLIVYATTSSFYDYSLLAAVVVAAVGVISFFVGFLLFPFKESKYYINYFNEEGLARLRAMVIINKI